MKRKHIILIFICLIIGVIIAVFVSNLINKTDTFKIANGISKVELKDGVQYDIDLEHATVFTNYDSFSAYFTSENISKEDFDKNNYAIITFSYDECMNTNIIPTKYTISGSNIKVTVYHDGCSSCAPLSVYYAVKVDKDITQLNITSNLIARNDKNCKKINII